MHISANQHRPVALLTKLHQTHCIIIMKWINCLEQQTHSDIFEERIVTRGPRFWNGGYPEKAQLHHMHMIHRLRDVEGKQQRIANQKSLNQHTLKTLKLSRPKHAWTTLNNLSQLSEKWTRHAKAIPSEATLHQCYKHTYCNCDWSFGFALLKTVDGWRKNISWYTTFLAQIRNDKSSAKCTLGFWIHLRIHTRSECRNLLQSSNNCGDGSMLSNLSGNNFFRIDLVVPRTENEPNEHNFVSNGRTFFTDFKSVVLIRHLFLFAGSQTWLRLFGLRELSSKPFYCSKCGSLLRIASRSTNKMFVDPRIINTYRLKKTRDCMS